MSTRHESVETPGSGGVVAHGISGGAVAGIALAVSVALFGVGFAAAKILQSRSGSKITAEDDVLQSARYTSI